MGEEGCTFWFDSVFGYDFHDICEMHDHQYRLDRKRMTRKQADINFLHDLLDRFPWWLDWMAVLMYFAVRLTCKPAWKRWEYKWYFGFIPIRRKWFGRE